MLDTVVEPLRANWADAQAAALLLANEANALQGKKHDDKLAEARAEIKHFHPQICTTRVLDRACGSGTSASALTVAEATLYWSPVPRVRIPPFPPVFNSTEIAARANPSLSPCSTADFGRRQCAVGR